ncbi:MAG: hypothetical protein Q8L53_16880 [Aestuariivirga sp.]|nr:hypothetical protein [Aestuariivirga sp.]
MTTSKGRSAVEEAVALLPKFKKRIEIFAGTMLVRGHNEKFSQDDLIILINALVSLEGVAAGTHVIVPVEPTDEMISDAISAGSETVDGGYEAATEREVYRAMIGASFGGEVMKHTQGKWTARKQPDNAAPDLYEALRNVQKLITEAALTGFNYKDGEWSQKLFESQQQTSAALAKAHPNQKQRGDV